MNIAFYDNYWSTAKQLPDDQRLMFFDAICKYAFEGIEPAFDDITLSFGFGFIKPNIDASVKAFNDGKRNGKPGRPRKNVAESKNPEKGFGNPKKGFGNPFKQLEQELQQEQEHKNSKAAMGRQTIAVCPNCGGEVVKSNCSPNWSCKTCRDVFTPMQAAMLQLKAGE